MEKIKLFYEWYINFIRNHPLLSLFSAFIKGMIVGGLIVSCIFNLVLSVWLVDYLIKRIMNYIIGKHPPSKIPYSCVNDRSTNIHIDWSNCFESHFNLFFSRVFFPFCIQFSFKAIVNFFTFV